MKRVQRRKKVNFRKQFTLNSRQTVQTLYQYSPGIAGGVMVLAGVVAAMICLRAFLLKSPLFSVTEIEVVDYYPDKIAYPLARIKQNPNIFRVDLARISRNLEKEYADIQQATVRRVLPNKLEIEVVRRTPAAQVELTVDNQPARFFSINQEGYILSDLGAAADADLPVIIGGGLTPQDVEIGKSCRRSRVRWATDFLAYIQGSDFVKRYRISAIDVTKPRSMTVMLDQYLEIRLGNKDWPEKIRQLLSVIPSLEIDPAQRYYLDVRFKDIVFGKREQG